MSSWRTALRIAWREAKRAKGRAALVAAMITLPVAALSFFAVTYDSFELTPTERAERLMGTGQAVVTWPQNGPVEQEPDLLFAFTSTESRSGAEPVEPAEPTTDRLLALLPAGSRAIPDQSGTLTVATAGGTGALDARMLDYADPLAQGMLQPLSGRAPIASNEVALTPAASERLGVGVGGTVRLAEGGRTFTVVGTVEEREHLEASTIVLRPGDGPAEPSTQRWLVATPAPLTWTQVKELNTHGVVAISRHVLENPPSTAERYEQRVTEGGPPFGVIVLVAGLAMLEIVLLAGPALAVGARRRRRELALVAAAGGTPSHVRRIVLADGLVLGLLAAVTGLVLGVAAAAVLRPVMTGVIDSRPGAFRLFPEALAGLAALAVVTGVLAALVPAWISARQDVVAALAGRRGITRSRRRWLVLGLVMIAAGAGLITFAAIEINETLIIAGVALGELGLVLCTPTIVGLVARLGRVLPLAPRIALRDTSRNRTAAAPAISAVMAVVVGSLAISVVYLAFTAQEAASSAGRPGDVTVLPVGGPMLQQSTPPQVLSALRDTSPVERIHEIRVVACGAQPCFAELETPADKACPYEMRAHELSSDEQQAALADPRCADVGTEHRYFSVLGTGGAVTVIIDESAVADVAGVSEEDAARVAAAMRDGAIVVSDPRYLAGDQATLGIGSLNSNETDRRVTAPGVALPNRPKAPIAMLTPETATALGLEHRQFLTLATTSRMPTQAEQDQVRAAAGSQFEVVVESGTEGDPTLLILAIVAGVITLGAAALATGLAAADSRADLATLAAVGASPRVRRMLSLSQSGVIAGLGSVLGVAAGLGASTAVLFALNQRYADVWPVPVPLPISMPWLNIGAALVAVPLVAMLGAGLLTRSRLPIERRRE